MYWKKVGRKEGKKEGRKEGKKERRKEERKERRKKGRKKERKERRKERRKEEWKEGRKEGSKLCRSNILEKHWRNRIVDNCLNLNISFLFHSNKFFLSGWGVFCLITPTASQFNTLDPGPKKGEIVNLEPN